MKSPSKSLKAIRHYKGTGMQYSASSLEDIREGSIENKPNIEAQNIEWRVLGKMQSPAYSALKPM